jgi:thiamine pyrophosphate-dependent acetolactate synthase large subunit-like protein
VLDAEIADFLGVRMAAKDSSTIRETVAPDQPLVPRDAQARWGSDRMAHLLGAVGIEYLCLNPGSSFRGLHDSVVNFLGNRHPQLMVCLHEEHAVAIAHGYAKVSGRPLAVALHANVGLMHATMAIFNAWCDRVPMLVLGGTGPVDAAKRRPFIDWVHTMRDQGALVRSYVKWDDQPASIDAAEEALLRAMQISCTAPAAPVYLNLDSGIQEMPLSSPGVPRLDLDRYKPVAQPAPDQVLLDQVVDLLRAARRPAILMGRVSRREEDWHERLILAERLGSPVATDLKAGAAFPTAHALHAGIPGMSLTRSAIDVLKDCDVVLSLDWIDLAGTLAAIWPGRAVPAKVIQVSMDYQLHNGFSFDHLALPPVDLHIATSPERFVPLLNARLPQVRPVGEPCNRTPSEPPRSGELTVAHIAAAIDSAAGETPVSLLRLPLGWDGSLRHFNHPLDQLGHSGGGGIGSGPGMSVGSALALRGSGRIPVAILGDGDTIMGIAAIWTAVHYKIPLLVIVANNRSYFNDEVHQERVAKRRNRPIENKWIGQRISEPDVDFASMAAAQGAFAKGPVTDFETMLRATAEAVAAVSLGKVALIDVHIAPGYDGSGAS